MTVEDDALIARLMAEEYGGYQDFDDAGANDGSDSDFEAELKKKAAKKGGGGGGKRGRPAGKKAAAGGAASAAQAPASPAPAAAVAPAPAPPAAQQPAAAMLANNLALAGAGGMALPQLPPAAFALPPGMTLQQAALIGAMGAFPLGMPLPPAAALAAAAAAPPAPQASGAAGAAPAAAAPQQKVAAGAAAEGEEEFTATGRRKRKDTGKQRQHSRSWSEEEERLFVEALQLHGRDWKKCAEHVGTRDARAFTSHAQKHFIKLLLRGEEVPDKVAETGRGYTLSGKPLDPNSSSAAAYGLKPDLFQAVCQGGRLQVGVHVTTFEMSEQAAAAARKAARPKSAGSPGGAGGGAPRAKRPRKGRAASEEEDLDLEDSEEEDAALAEALAASAAMAPGVRTEYARNRPRREVGQRARLGETTESLELTHLQEYVGLPGSGAPAAQPFSVVVESQALLVADFHAHLSRCEVIGLLGGTFDAERRVMEIKEAYPCRRVAGSDSSTSVELDAESQVEATSAMEERGLIPVGWYHSHPIFEPRPSAKDNENQRNYQALCRDPATGLEPWVGLIVGPYDLALESPHSGHQLWVVKMHAGGLQPFNVRHAIRPGPPAEDVQEKLAEALDQLLEDPGRVDLAERWRGYSALVNSQPAGPPLTKLEKLRASLAQHLLKVPSEAAAAFLDGVQRSIQASWGVSLPAPAPLEAAAAPAPAGAGEVTSEQGGGGEVVKAEQGSGDVAPAVPAAPAVPTEPVKLEGQPVDAGSMSALLAGAVGPGGGALAVPAAAPAAVAQH